MFGMEFSFIITVESIESETVYEDQVTNCIGITAIASTTLLFRVESKSYSLTHVIVSRIVTDHHALV